MVRVSNVVRVSKRSIRGSYGRGSVDPHQGGLLGVGQLPVDEHTLLQVQQQRRQRHETQGGEQDGARHAQPCQDANHFTEDGFIPSYILTFTEQFYPKLLTRETEGYQI